MSWNYRVVRRLYPEQEEGDRVIHGIHSAHYSKDGKVRAISVEPEVVLSAEGDLAGLRETFSMMARALEEPVLDYDTREEISDTDT